jgi:hypothetical protein
MGAWGASELSSILSTPTSWKLFMPFTKEIVERLPKSAIAVAVMSSQLSPPLVAAQAALTEYLYRQHFADVRVVASSVLLGAVLGGSVIQKLTLDKKKYCSDTNVNLIYAKTQKPWISVVAGLVTGLGFSYLTNPVDAHSVLNMFVTGHNQVEFYSNIISRSVVTFSAGAITNMLIQSGQIDKATQLVGNTFGKFYSSVKEYAFERLGINDGDLGNLATEEQIRSAVDVFANVYKKTTGAISNILNASDIKDLEKYNYPIPAEINYPDRQVPAFKPVDPYLVFLRGY